MQKTKHLTYQEALSKLRQYCAYQDRCHSEVRSKLLDLKVYGDTLEEVMTDLIKENFLNEERFAKSYVRGKHRMKLWGKRKIIRNLKIKQVSDYCIRKGLKEIDEQDYLAGIEKLISKYVMSHATLKGFTLQNSLIRYLTTRGYDYSEFEPLLKKI